MLLLYAVNNLMKAVPLCLFTTLYILRKTIFHFPKMGNIRFDSQKKLLTDPSPLLTVKKEIAPTLFFMKSWMNWYFTLLHF